MAYDEIDEYTPLLYAVQGLAHEDMSTATLEYMEKNLRRELLQGLHEVLFDGDIHTVQTYREERRALSCDVDRPRLCEIIYKAEIRTVQQRHVELKIMPQPIDVVSYRSEYRKKSKYRKAQGWRK